LWLRKLQCQNFRTGNRIATAAKNGLPGVLWLLLFSVPGVLPTEVISTTFFKGSGSFYFLNSRPTFTTKISWEKCYVSPFLKTKFECFFFFDESKYSFCTITSIMTVPVFLLLQSSFEKILTADSFHIF
jgi:hypothetical protein